MTWLQNFLPDEANRSLAPAFLAFCVAGVGGAINAFGWMIEVRWVAVAGIVIAAAGIFAGVIAVAYGFVVNVLKLSRKVRSDK